MANDKLKQDVVLQRVAEKFADDKPLYLILNDPIADPVRAGYTLIFRDQRRPMPGWSNEHYYVYQRVSAPNKTAVP